MTNSTTDISAMKKLMQTYIFNLIAAVALLSGMASCTDDTDMPRAIDDGTTSITLRIPNPESAAEFARSRAATGDPDPSQNAEEGEGAIKSLWLLAYPTDGTESVVRKLLSSGQVTNEYSDYKITIKPGDYRLYVVANLDSYIDDPISATTDEEELKSLVLNFSPERLPNLSDGLPMACLPSEIDEAGDDGTVAIAPGHNVTVHADMTFLCAKVRYTIMFDNSADGFSRPAFGDNTVTISDGSFSGVIASTSLITPATTTTERAFEIDPAPLAAGEATIYTRSWQGTVYLPENLLTGKDRTLLHLNATLDTNDTPLSYTIPLPSPDADKQSAEAKTLKRGHYYDLTGRITTLGDKLDLTAEVKDWTLLTLTYDLHGPYFLHVEKTAVEIYAGIETLIPYDTDAGQLDFEYEFYTGSDGVERELLECKTVERDGKQYISVNVNPKIPAEDKELKSWFIIKAANLKKRIEATIVSLKPFFNVSPTEIEVNIREYIASGEYEAEIPISFSTNLNKVTITGDDSFCGSMTLEGDKTYTGAKEGKNILKITGLNGGTDWTETKTFTLTYTAEGYPDPIPVTITVKPNILNYLIHFRAPADWTHPHIYVYQCLQLPSNRTDGNSGKIVGYYNEDKSDAFAALEYSFTGKIAFRGWNYSQNNPNAAGSSSGNDKKGFFIFDNWQSWDPSRAGFETHYYNDYDFCKAHRDTISSYASGVKTECQACEDEPKRTWPGILMHNDNNGWWTFELTGVATPGKALIMFSNGHGGDHNKRYPGLNEDKKSLPGIPLFDYPNREGWLDYAASGDKAQFTNTKPGDLPRRTYRLYWPKELYNGVNIWYSATGNSIINTIDPTTFKTTQDGSYMYYEWVRDFEANEEKIKISSQGKKNAQDSYLDLLNHQLGDFTEAPDEPGVYCYTRIQQNGYSGKPEPTPKYRIWWHKDSRNACHIDRIYIGGDTSELNHGEETYQGRTCYYYDVETAIDPINIWLYEQGNPGSWKNEYVWDKNDKSNSSKFTKVDGKAYDYETLIY